MASILYRNDSAATAVLDDRHGQKADIKSVAHSLKSRLAEPAVRKKLVVVGDGACGKSSMLTVYSTGKFPEDYVPTVFESFVSDIQYQGRKVELALWDTAGQRDYDRLRSLSYPGTDVVLICFAIDCRDSYQNVMEKWIPEVVHHLPKTPIVLVGLKADMRDNYSRRQYCLKEHEPASQILAKHPTIVKYMECSAKTGVGIREVIDAAVGHSLAVKRKAKKMPCYLM